jgi:hypothetical protein
VVLNIVPFISLQVIEAELRSTKCWELTTEGEEIAREGSHEARVFRSIPLEGLVQSELMVGPGWGPGRGWGASGPGKEHSSQFHFSSTCPAARWASARPCPTSGSEWTRVPPTGPGCSEW